MDVPQSRRNTFAFLFRTDLGEIERSTWSRGSLALLAVAAFATMIWHFMRRFTVDALNQPPLLALAGYLYLLVYAFGMIIVLVSLYNLSAKRFSAIGLRRSLAAIFPASLLLAGTVDWYVPRSEGSLPPWFATFAFAIVILIAAWNTYALGIRAGR